MHDVQLILRGGFNMSVLYDNHAPQFKLWLFLLALMLTLGAGGMLWYISHEMRKQQFTDAVEDARVFASSVTQFRNFYTNEIVPRARDSGMVITHAYQDLPNSLPLPATFTLEFGEFISAQREGFGVSLYSEHPFFLRVERELDSFQLDAIEALKNDPDRPFVRFETVEGESTLRFAVADRMKPACVSCHNSYPGSPKTDWQEGDIRGVLEVRRLLNINQAGISDGLRNAAYASAGLIVILLGTLWFAMAGMNRAMISEARSNHQLRRTQQRLEQQIFALDQHAIVSMAAPDGSILDANKRFCDISGYSRDELIGQNHRLVNSGLHSPDFFAHLWSTISSGSVWSGEIRNQRKDGSFYWVSATIVPFMDDNGQPEHYIGIRTDISERKAWEEETLRAKEVAEAANRAKSDFLANMSHEIRTPMNGIIGMTGLALDAQSENERHEYMLIVRNSAESLLGILNDILDFSKIEANKLMLEQVSFDLRQIVSETLKIISARANEKELELICDLAPEVPRSVVGDPTRLRQVLINLLGNAIKFTQQGEILVTITLEQAIADEVILLFSVRDTGIGIPAEKLNTIFEAFAQADTSTTREFGGTGLGLSISASLVELMGGSMSVTSEPGLGSTFYFTLRLPVNLQSSIPLETEDLHGLQVMIVDDNSVNLEILQNQIQRWGMRSIRASSAEMALSMLQTLEHAPDLFILDQHMPSMDGLSLASSLREITVYRKSPIIILSSGPVKDDAERASSLHISHYLTKPIMEDDLLATVQRSLGYGGVTALMPKLANSKTESANPSNAQDPVRLRVLLVEDNPVNQKLARLLLEKRGCSVDVVDNGQLAFERLFGTDISMEFDLVFMDMQMPVMGGLEATRLIRQHEFELALCPIPIVAMTANAMQGDREMCIEAGMNDYLSKPINNTELTNLLVKLFPDNFD